MLAAPSSGACAEWGLKRAALTMRDRCRKRLAVKAWLTFPGDVIQGGYRVEHPTDEDLRRCRELQETHADLQLGVSTRASSP